MARAHRPDWLRFHGIRVIGDVYGNSEDFGSIAATR